MRLLVTRPREALWRREQALLEQMDAIAEAARRHFPDAKARHLIDWLRKSMCLDLPPFGQWSSGPPAVWERAAGADFH